MSMVSSGVWSGSIPLSTAHSLREIHPGTAQRRGLRARRRALDADEVAGTADGPDRRREGEGQIGQQIVRLGGRRRLDYTAYGVVVNKAARFQGTNKELGSSICVGEVATQRVGGAIAMRSLGKVAVRGMQERCQLFEPWDAEVPDDLRLLYDEAMEVMDSDPAAARARLEEYAAKGAPDRVVRTWLTQRLPA